MVLQLPYILSPHLVVLVTFSKFHYLPHTRPRIPNRLLNFLNSDEECQKDRHRFPWNLCFLVSKNILENNYNIISL